MGKPEILSETPLCIPELQDELSNIKKRDGELNFRGNRTEEYLGQFKQLKLKDAKDLADKLAKLDIPRMKDMHIKKLINLLPETPEDVKVILQGYTLTVTQPNLKKIADVIKEYPAK